MAAPTAELRAHLVVCMQRADGSVAVLLGYRRTGPCAGTWTDMASDLDTHCLLPAASSSKRPPSPLEAAARAGHAGGMGLLGTAAQIAANLNTVQRVRIADGVFAYLLRFDHTTEYVAELYNNFARYAMSAFPKSKHDGGTELVGCPPAVLAFTRLQWVGLEELTARVLLAGAHSAVRTATPATAAALTLTPRTLDLLRHVLPALERMLVEPSRRRPVALRSSARQDEEDGKDEEVGGGGGGDGGGGGAGASSR